MIRRITLPDSKPCYKATEMEAVLYLHKNRLTDQCEENTEDRNKLTSLWSIDFQQRHLGNSKGK